MSVYQRVTGWWLTYPSEKYASSSVGMIIPFPIWWESHSKFHGSSHHQPDPLIPLICWYWLFTHGTYPLVNVYKKLWKITMFNGKISTISMAIFNSYVSLPEGINHLFFSPFLRHAIPPAYCQTCQVGINGSMSSTDVEPVEETEPQNW